MVSGENGARVVSFLTPTCPPVPCCSNRPHVPAGPSIPRSVAGEPPHLQVKRARYRCKSSSLLLCPLQSLPPLSLSSSSRLLCPSLSFSQLFIHLIHVLAHHKDNILLVPPHPLRFAFFPLPMLAVSPLSARPPLSTAVGSACCRNIDLLGDQLVSPLCAQPGIVPR